MVCQEAIPVVKEYNLKRHCKSRHEAKHDNIRKQEIVYYQRARNYCLNSYANYILIGIYYLSVVKTFVARNKFPHAKVARNPQKVGQT